MSTKKNFETSLIWFGFALLSILIYEFGIRNLLFAPSSPGSALVSVVFAKNGIKSGSRIVYNDLAVKKVSLAQCPANAVYDPWIAIGRTVKETLNPGEIVDFENIGLAVKVNKD